MKVTIKDIAKESGVGIATVSRVINNSGYVSPETQKRVLETIKKYNYRSSSLVNKIRTDKISIGVFVKGIGNPFFQKITRSLEREFNMRGCDLAFFDVLYLDEIEFAEHTVRLNGFDGTIFLGGSTEYSKEDIEKVSCPVLLLTVGASLDIPKDLYCSVQVDDEEEGFKVTQSLIDLGHREIGFIYLDNVAIDTPNYNRYKGYKKALQENGISYKESLVAGSNSVSPEFSTEVNGYRLGFRMMQELINNNPNMTAVFAYSDTLAIGAAKCALVSGRKIPEQMSIIGFDGIDEAEFFHPAIDTVRQPTDVMVSSAATLLINRINGGAAEHEILSCNLVRRGSSIKI